MDDELTIVPANEAGCADLQTVFGARGAAAHCQCQRYKLRPRRGIPQVRPTKRRVVMRVDF